MAIVTLRYWAAAKEAAGDAEEVEAQPRTTLADALAAVLARSAWPPRRAAAAGPGPVVVPGRRPAGGHRPPETVSLARVARDRGAAALRGRLSRPR